MRFERTTLGTKIYISEALTVGFLLLLGISNIYSLSKMEGRIDRSVNREARKIELAGNVNAAIAMTQNLQRGVLLGALTSDARLLDASRRSLEDARQKLAGRMKEFDALLVSGEDRRTFSSLNAGAEELLRALPQFEAHINGQRFDEATKMQAEVFQPLFARMLADVDALVMTQHQLLASNAAEASGEATTARWLCFTLCLLSVGVAAAGFWVIWHGNRGLRRIAGEIAEGARQVASAAAQVSSSSQALAQGSSEQAASLEETSASAEEVNSMTQKNAESARGAAVENENADVLLKETDQKLSQMIGSMKEINASSEKISKIIRVIDEIAFQTNILALNAAVEAARAGEAGMGFAVVADEVRNLAQRCAQAAKDTSDLIEESIVRSNEGRLRLDEVSGCVARVFENAARIKTLVSEVHLGSKEQARGIEQIARAVTQMQQLTQSTAASAEQGASAGEEMSAQAQSLQDSVRRLHELVGVDEEGAAISRAVQVRPALVSKSAPAAVATPPSKRAQIPLDDDFRDF